MDRKRTIVFVIIAIATLFLSFCHNSEKYEMSNINNFSDNPLWTYKSSEAISATPEIDDQRVFLRTLNSVIALDIQTGKIIWRATSQGDRPLSPSPKAFGNYLIVPEVASGIAVFDTNSGTLVWRIPGIDIAKSQHLTAHIRSITSADNELVYVVRFDWALTAYELKTGRVVWEQKFSDRALPYLSSNTDVVYLALGKTLRAFDAIQGDLIWEMSTDGYWGPIFVYKNILYAIDEARLSLQAINLKTQEIIWKEYYPAAQKYEARCLSVSNDLLYFTSQRLFAVSLDNGQKIWETENLGYLECPVIVGDKLYIRNIQETLFTFELTSGKEIGKMVVEQNTHIKQEPSRSPNSNGRFLVIPVDSYTLVTYQP